VSDGRCLFPACPELGEIGERQWMDILGVIKVQGSMLDVDNLKKWAEKIEVLDLLRKDLCEGGMREVAISGR